MTATDFGGSHTGTRTDGARAVRHEVRDSTETRRAFKTTEFFVMLASIAAVIVAGYASDDSLDVARIWTLVTVLAAAYMVSRGLAKAGSYEREDREVGAHR
jgi:hypothetical protein